MVSRFAIVIALLLPQSAPLCVSSVSYGTAAAAPASLVLDAVPLRAGWRLWATVDTDAALDDGEPFTLGPQSPRTLDGSEAYLLTRGPGPYLVHLCAPGDVPAGAGWDLFFAVTT